ncbi:uncharacterized protein LOC121441686 isoform X1 [Microtus oregoni]|uniref:uncharacterized protein LOC121441686 isoform X1 n=1 Tax=Microtus oregoni TaxID=111838 RepID=UPI001BB219AB|nr:uncharacterized protein LOC121441686 isoform X1 [Microtus oregoni]
MNFLIIQGGRKALGPLGSGGAQPGSALRRAPITPSQVLCGQLCGGARTAGPPPVSAAGIRLTVRGFGTAEPHAAESQASALQFSWRRAPNAEEAALAVPVPRLTGRGWVLPTPPLKAGADATREALLNTRPFPSPLGLSQPFQSAHNKCARHRMQHLPPQIRAPMGRQIASAGGSPGGECAPRLCPVCLEEHVGMPASGP